MWNSSVPDGELNNSVDDDERKSSDDRIFNDSRGNWNEDDGARLNVDTGNRGKGDVHAYDRRSTRLTGADSRLEDRQADNKTAESQIS